MAEFPFVRYEMPPCPAPDCGQTLEQVTFWGGWEVYGWEGATVGNYEDGNPPAELLGDVKACRAFDRYRCQPCGHEITRDQARALHDECRRRESEARKAAKTDG